MSDQILALIPARGGSKGIPRKNVRLVAGKPLLAYTIEHARQTPCVSRTIVSTDDSEIARVAGTNGAEVIARPEEISGDTATSESALLHALDVLKDREGYEPGLVVFLQATSPLREPGDVPNAVATLQGEGADSLFSASPVHGFLWHRTNGELSSVAYDYRCRPRRQDIGEGLMENGSIYVFKPWVLRKFNNRLGGKIAVYRMGFLESLQLDEPTDLEVVETLLRRKTVNRTGTHLGRIRLLVLDFDGVLTDDHVMVNADGVEAVWCHRGDGLGIAELKKTGVEVIVLSAETNPVVAARCRKLDVPCFQGVLHKQEALEKLAKERGLSPQEIAYVGNDVNDLEAMTWAGVSIAVADAAPEVRAAAALVTTRPGGQGAVREVGELIMRSRGGDSCHG